MSRYEVEFRPGDRVEMTAPGYSAGLEGRVGRPCFGRVIRMARSGEVVVIREGLKSEEYYHVGFWRLAEGTAPNA